MHHLSECHKKKTSFIVISSHIERPKATFVARPNHMCLAYKRQLPGHPSRCIAPLLTTHVLCRCKYRYAAS